MWAGLARRGRPDMVEEQEYYPVPRTGACAASVQGKLYVWGGEEVKNSSISHSEVRGNRMVHGSRKLSPGSREVASTIELFDPYLEIWSSLTTTGHSPPNCLSGGRATSTGHYMYICCGTAEDRRYNTHLYELDVRSLTWKQLPSYPMNRYFCYLDQPEMVCNQHKLVLFGGMVCSYPIFGQSTAANDASLISNTEIFAFNFKDGMCHK